MQTGVGPFLAIYLAGYAPLKTRLDREWSVLLGRRAPDHCFLSVLLARSSGPASDQWNLERVGPAICAISLGIVGHELFDRRQGRNQTFNSAGNVVAAISMGLIGYYISNRGIFFFVVVFAIPTIVALRLIQPEEIDYEVARGTKDDSDEGKPERMWALLKDRRLLIFLVCAVMFHFANAAMLPLLGEMLATGHGRTSMTFTSACVITTQVVVVLLASSVGRAAGVWGRKPLLLIAFAVLPVRGILYTLTHDHPRHELSRRLCYPLLFHA